MSYYDSKRNVWIYEVPMGEYAVSPEKHKQYQKEYKEYMKQEAIITPYKMKIEKLETEIIELGVKIEKEKEEYKAWLISMVQQYLPTDHKVDCTGGNEACDCGYLLLKYHHIIKEVSHS